MKNIILIASFIISAIALSAQSPEESVRFSHEGFLAFSLFQYENWQGENNASVSLVGNYQINLAHGQKFFKGEHELFGELGFQQFGGKPIYKYADNFYFDSKLSISFTEKAAVTLTSNIQSQFMPNYELGDTVTLISNNLKSSFLTPAFWTLGGALSLEPNEEVAFHFSMLSTRMTYLREQDKLITDDGSDTYLYGLSIGKKLKFDLGGNLELDIDKELSSNCSWQNRSAIFYDYRNQAVTANTRNQLTFRLSKFFKLMINTDLVYSPLENTDLQLRNELLLGVYF